MSETVSGQPSATVILAIEVPDGAESEYQEWQRRVNEAAASFPGFVGAEIIPPTPGTQERWTCLYRFRTAEELGAWLESDVRHRFLQQAKGRFDDVSQRTLASNEPDAGVTLVVSHRVPEGEVARFLRLQAETDASQAAFPGYRGMRLLRPVPGVQPEWTALVRFDSEEHLRAWLDSEERSALVRSLDEIGAEFDTEVVGSSFGSWFSFTMRDGVATPNWKQWLTVLLALYPVVMVLNLITKYLPGGTDSQSYPPARWFFLNMWVGNFLSTLLLTFAVMPLVTRGLRRWLEPKASRRATWIGLGAIALMVGATLLVFDRVCAGGC